MPWVSLVGIIVAITAVRDLNKLEDKLSRTILAELTVLKDNPFPRGKLIKKIKGKRANFFSTLEGKNYD